MTARRLLVLALVLGLVGSAAELVLLEHWEDWKQWSPFAVIALTLLALLVGRGRPALLRGAGALQALTGAVGIVLHTRGNFLYEAENHPERVGQELWQSVATGSSPLLAPGALCFAGLVLIALTLLPDE
ncbi:MAG: hypothetical protein MUF00_01180 [Gemmatimonadaceae bacterium]|jgi:hypothetical protein|nr:hypothetical protein [Gemmatimonadaceae bacterium]